MELIAAREAMEYASPECLSPREAFVTLLVAAARADGSVSPHEADRIELAVASMRLFRDSSQEALHAMFASVVKRIDERGSDLVGLAAAAVPVDLRATAFAMAVDLLLADGRWTRSEEHFAGEIQTLLGVDDELATKVVDILTLKNAGARFGTA